jgi:hypothetical protein
METKRAAYAKETRQRTHSTAELTENTAARVERAYVRQPTDTKNEIQ